MDKKIAVVGYSLSGSIAAKQALLKHNVECTTIDEVNKPIDLNIDNKLIAFEPKWYPEKGSKFHK